MTLNLHLALKHFYLYLITEYKQESETTYVLMTFFGLKLEVLTNLANETNISTLLREFQVLLCLFFSFVFISVCVYDI